MMAVRARIIAEWNRVHHVNTLTRGLREIDKEASRLDPKLPAEEKGIVRTALMGGSLAREPTPPQTTSDGNAPTSVKTGKSRATN